MDLQEEISRIRDTIESVFFILLKYFTAPLEHFFYPNAPPINKQEEHFLLTNQILKRIY
jgi:hypothetical protein